MGKVHIRFLQEVNWQAIPPLDVALTAGAVHVYRISISGNVPYIEAFSATLTAAEKERGSRYFQLNDRERFVVSRGAQRKILARYVNQPANQLQFLSGNNKKPYLAGSDIQYNITHAGDWILLAISDSPVGVDVEYVDPEFQFDDILAEHFSEPEISFINQANATEKFYLLWTRKEALLKATGQGLGEHLIITPSLDGEHAIPGELLGADACWQVNSFTLPQGHLGAVTNIGDTSQLHFFDFGK